MTKKAYSNQQLFEMWVSLGLDYKRLSEVTNLSMKSLYNYSTVGQWRDKADQLGEEGKAALKAITANPDIRALLITDEVYGEVGQRLLGLLQELKTIQLKDVKNVKTAIETINLIQGKPTEITQTQTLEVPEEALAEMTDEELDTLSKLQHRLGQGEGLKN